jgi:hypothetical protein
MLLLNTIMPTVPVFANPEIHTGDVACTTSECYATLALAVENA